VNHDQRRIIFGLGSALGLDLDGLRDIAADINGGKRSLSALSDAQADVLKNHLRQIYNRVAVQKEQNALAEGHQAKRPDGRAWDYTVKGQWSQTDYMFDMMLKLGWDIWELRAWLKHYLKVDHEGFLSTAVRNKAVEALKAMLERKRKSNRERQDG